MKNNRSDTGFTTNYYETAAILENALQVNESFDIIKKELNICERNAAIYFIDGFIKDAIMEKLIEYLVALDSIDKMIKNKENGLTDAYIPYVEVEKSRDLSGTLKNILSGAVCLIMDGIDYTVIIDARTYPTRSIQEPENDRVMRGPRESFVETLIFNTALIRRRIRSTELRMKIMTVGKTSQTDVVMCYMEDRASKDLVKLIEKKIKAISQTDALSMGHESLAECLIQKCWFNPFPKIRYTERPDTASASILEGSIVVVCDNSPAVMLLPTSFFDFLQETDDYYFPSITGSYLRLVRMGIFLIALLLAPTWYFFVAHPQYLPETLSFILPKETGAIPIILQIYMVELAVDGLKLASMNTPNMLSNSISIIGGLILGELAVNVGWFVSEVIFYMAFVAIANFTQPSYELGYAFKFMRMLLLALTAVLGLWGYFGGILLILALIALNKTVDEKHSYLYPLIPFNGKALRRLIFRTKLKP